MAKKFMELKSTDNQIVYIRKEAIAAIEVAAPSARVEGHIKVYVEGYKFLIQAEKDELLKELES